MRILRGRFSWVKIRRMPRQTGYEPRYAGCVILMYVFTMTRTGGQIDGGAKVTGREVVWCSLGVQVRVGSVGKVGWYTSSSLLIEPYHKACFWSMLLNYVSHELIVILGCARKTDRGQRSARKKRGVKTMGEQTNEPTNETNKNCRPEKRVHYRSTVAIKLVWAGWRCLPGGYVFIFESYFHVLRFCPVATYEYEAGTRNERLVCSLFSLRHPEISSWP